MNSTAFKSERLLQIYLNFSSGQVLNKAELARQYHVSLRSIQLDIDFLRSFLANQHSNQEIIYDPSLKGFCLRNYSQLLSNSEVLAVCKILLESRSLRRDEMLPLLDKLVENCVPERNKAVVKELISNEKFHYIEPRHGQRILDRFWEIGEAVRNQRVMEIQYERLKEPKLQTRTIEPVGIMFSEYYFYLVAILRDIDRKTEFENPDDLFPTIYRIDRIQAFRVLDERFEVPYRNRFEEGIFESEFSSCLGESYSGFRWMVEAEEFGKGIEMWLKGQGNYIQDKQFVEYSLPKIECTN